MKKKLLKIFNQEIVYRYDLIVSGIKLKLRSYNKQYKPTIYEQDITPYPVFIDDDIMNCGFQLSPRYPNALALKHEEGHIQFLHGTAESYEELIEQEIQADAYSVTHGYYMLEALLELNSYFEYISDDACNSVAKVRIEKLMELEKMKPVNGNIYTDTLST